MTDEEQYFFAPLENQMTDTRPPEFWTDGVSMGGQFFQVHAGKTSFEAISRVDHATVVDGQAAKSRQLRWLLIAVSVYAGWVTLGLLTMLWVATR
jgi:hypothetical protein